MEKAGNATALISAQWMRGILVRVFVVRKCNSQSAHTTPSRTGQERSDGLHLCFHIRLESAILSHSSPARYRLSIRSIRNTSPLAHSLSLPLASFHCRNVFIHPIQVHSFDEAQLSDLPRNLILSQEWRMNARPIPTLPTLRKPVTYQPTVVPPPSMFNQQEKRKSLETDGNVDGTSSHGIAAIVNAFNKSSANGSNGTRSSRSSSVASTQPVVSNLVRIYSEATAHKQPNQKHRSSSVISTSKHDELTRIFEQASNRSHPSSSPSVHRRQAQMHEQPYEEIAWDTVAHG